MIIQNPISLAFLFSFLVIFFVSTDTVQAQIGLGSRSYTNVEIRKDDHIYGSSDAEISMVSYCGLDEPFCKRFYPDMIAIVDESYGKVNWAYRHFPLSFHQYAQSSAEASECVASLGGNDSFWKFIDKIYKTANDPTPELLEQIAIQLDINQEEFNGCMMAHTFQSNIANEAERGSMEGATGSPATFIISHRNGRQSFVSGAYPKINFLNHIEALISPFSSEYSLLNNMKERLCTRVERYKNNPSVLRRVQQRIMNRFGFRCNL